MSETGKLKLIIHLRQLGPQATLFHSQLQRVGCIQGKDVSDIRLAVGNADIHDKITASIIQDRK